MDEVEDQLRTHKLVTNFLFQCVSLCIGLCVLSCSTENLSDCDSDKACPDGLFCDIDGNLGDEALLPPTSQTETIFGGELVTLQADSSLASNSSGDYPLLVGSLAISAGNAITSIEPDIDGDARDNWNSSPDIGADEYKESQ